MPEARTPWAGRTKDRFVSKTSVESTPEIERLVRRAVVRAKQGDREAVRFLYLRYADNVYSYVRTIVRDHDDAEDVTQQVFAKLLTAVAKYEDRGTPFVAWLLRMSHNVAIDAVRGRRETPADEVYGPEEYRGETPAEDAGSLREAIAALPEDQREVVVMRHVLGLSPLEIAERTGRTPSSVYGLHHRGRRALCAELVSRDAAPAAHRQIAVAA